MNNLPTLLSHPAEPQIDESLWKAWVARGRAHDRQTDRRMVTAFTCSCLAALLTALGMWFHVASNVMVASAAVAASVIVFATSFAWRPTRTAIVPILLVGVTAASASAADISRYRDMQLGMDLRAIVKLTGASDTDVKVTQSRPALLQELEWRPQSGNMTAEPVKSGMLYFYDGALYRIAVSYDRYQTEGMTVDDFVEAMSASYGSPAKLTRASNSLQQPYGHQDEVLAHWEDPSYRLDLVRNAYDPAVRLNLISKKMEGPLEASLLEAKRLDDREAPQREAARVVSEKQVEKDKLEKARLMNKPKFRP